MEEWGPMTHRVSAPVSAVVVNYNGERYLAECLDAILSQDPAPAEVLVVDNASTDGSRVLVESRGERVRWIPLAVNEGPSPSRNRGLAEARHEWVLLVDNDAVLMPGTLAALLEAGAARPDVAVVQPRSLFHDDPGRVHYDGGSFHYCGLISLANFYTPLSEAQGRGVLERDCAVSVVLLVRREVLIRLGGFDPRYFILFEDLDLSYRLRLSGWKILSAEEALVLHKGGTGGISFRKGPRYPARRVFLHARNRWIFLLKNLSGWTLACALPGLLLYELAGLGFALLARAPHQWLLGKLDGLRLLPGLLAERRRIQSTRTVPDRELLPVVPLTVTPDARRGLRGGLERALSACLGAWWHCARILLAKH
jgi:hypothetical protein